MKIATKFFLEALVIGVMPCLYGCATRLPFIYFVIHLSQHFLLQWETIGFCVGAYQGCRAVSSSLAIFAPEFSHFLGTFAGLAGFTLVYFSDNDLVVPFVAGTAIVGLSETMSPMQKYAKEMYKLDIDREKTQLMLKLQYASVMIGVVFAFSIGGIVYQRYAINGVALFGIIVEGFGLMACLAYFSFFRDPVNIIQTGFIADKEHDKLKMQVEGDEKNPTSAQESQNRILAREDENQLDAEITISSLLMVTNAEYNNNANIPATWINWLICITFGIEALAIGYKQSIGPIFILNQFEQDTGVIGVIFAIGAAAGTCVAIGVTCTDIGSSIMKKIATAPFDLCFAMFGIGIGVLIATVPSFPLHVVSIILLMCFNDLGAILLTELQASITTVASYSLLGPLGQVVRRSFNAVTALTGPVLFGVHPRLPYFTAGVVTLLWAVGLTVAFSIRTNDTSKKLARELRRKTDSVMLHMNFATREVVKSCRRNRRTHTPEKEEKHLPREEAEAATRLQEKEERLAREAGSGGRQV